MVHPPSSVPLLFLFAFLTPVPFFAFPSPFLSLPLSPLPLHTSPLSPPPPSAIKREEAKVEKSLKDAAKQGNKDVALILAKEVLQSRKAVSKMYASMAQINSVMMSMDHQLGRSCDSHVIVM